MDLASSSSAPCTDVVALKQKLMGIIRENGLQSFYPPGNSLAVLQKVARINFGEIAAELEISKEMAYDLASLALYDTVFYCEDSESMAFEEDGDQRIADLEFILSKVSGMATMFDGEGITVRFMNSDVNGDGIRNAVDVANLITGVNFTGMTPLEINLDRKIIQPLVLGPARSNMAKPVHAIIIVAGTPLAKSHDKICEVIEKAKHALAETQYGVGAFAVQIVQVGKDAQAQQFLASVDQHPVVGRMIGVTPYYKLEEKEFAQKGVTSTKGMWLLKMCVGAINPEYDSYC